MGSYENMKKYMVELDTLHGTSDKCLVLGLCECRLTVFWVDCKCFLYTDRFKSTAHTHTQ